MTRDQSLVFLRGWMESSAAFCELMHALCVTILPESKDLQPKSKKRKLLF